MHIGKVTKVDLVASAVGTGLALIVLLMGAIGTGVGSVF